MAQIAHEQAPRVSQALPTVKCSSCGVPVPLASLGDHVCTPPPALPSIRPPQNPPLLASTLGSDSRKSVSEKPSKHGEHVPAPSLGRDPLRRPTPDISNKTQPVHARTPPPPNPVSPPPRLATPPAHRVTSPSVRSRPTPPISPTFPVSVGDAPPHPVRPPALSPARRDNPPPPPLRSPFSIHPSPNATPPLNIHPSPPFERFRSSSNSLDKSHSSLDKLRPALDVRRPSLQPHSSSPGQSQSAPTNMPLAGSVVSSPAPVAVSFPVLPPPMSTRQPPPPPLSLVRGREIDTKIGGEAGMAGVGRRGFAAAARAAMLAASLSPVRAPPGDAHPANVSQYLDRNSTLGHVMRAAMTPPSSPNSAHTPSPVSPYPVSPTSLGNGINGQYPRLPSPHDAMSPRSPAPTSSDKAHPITFTPTVRIASPSLIPNPFERRLSSESISQSPIQEDNLPLPFLDVLKPDLDLENESDEESVYTTHTGPKKNETRSPSPSADSEVGLAYVNESDDDTPVVMPLDVCKSVAPRDRRHPSGPSRQISASSLRSATSASSSVTSSVGPVRSRSASAATQSTAKSVGALARAMETLIEEGASVSVLASGSLLASIGGPASSRSTGKPSRSNTVPGPASPEQKPPKLPTRSHTSPSHPHVHSERVGVTGEVARVRNRALAKRKVRICAGCSSKIEDGRWIQMDGGSVLCECCWKNMYLPKCRRCNLPIEKQAVSSRDGQLKGKYHKDCFNCHSCQKPFPDKEFYVFDGKPFCAYHYHEANNSLCGTSSCGQPIEGPCAVTHSGKRYHPEHLLCEFEEGCKERLEEYWEVDGQMLCEHHAIFIGNHEGSWTRGSDTATGAQVTNQLGKDEGRMMKRMTRFIDLGVGGDDGLDIR